MHLTQMAQMVSVTASLYFTQSQAYLSDAHLKCLTCFPLSLNHFLKREWALTSTRDAARYLQEPSRSLCFYSCSRNSDSSKDAASLLTIPIFKRTMIQPKKRHFSVEVKPRTVKMISANIINAYSNKHLIFHVYGCHQAFASES